MPSPEKGPQPPEFKVDTEGLNDAVVIAAQELQEAKKFDEQAASSPSSGPMGNIARAHYMDQAAIARQKADLVSGILERVVPRSDGTRWQEIIQTRAGE